jgi:large subunit ribosomal protein L25
MQTKLTLNVTLRAQTGRSASRRTRKAGHIPAVLYGKHTPPETLAIDNAEFVRLRKAVQGRALLIELQRPDKPERAISFFQEIQRDPLTDRYLHIDLHEVKADEIFEIQVPVSVAGEAYGVKKQSGVLEMASHTLRVRCLPKNLPPVIEVDVTELKVGETIKVAELKAIAGVQFLDPKGQPVVACVEPVAEIVQETVAAAPASGAAAAPAVGADGKPVAAAAGAAAPAGDAKAGAAAAPAAAGAKPAAGAAAAKPAAPAKK